MIDTSQIGMCISIHNRLEYTEKSFDSLIKNPPLPGIDIIIMDDGSTEFKAINLKQLAQLRMLGHLVYPFRKEIPIGINKIVPKFVNTLKELNKKYIYITDNDTLYGKNWCEMLIRCYEHYVYHHPRTIVTAFNTDAHPEFDASGNTELFTEKYSIGGVSWFTNMHTMIQLLDGNNLSSSWDWACVRKLKNDIGGIIGSTRKSYIQHIGEYGMNSNAKHGHCDKGKDFVGV